MESTLTIITACAAAVSAVAVIFQTRISQRQSRLMANQLELQRQTTQAYNIAIWSDSWDYTNNKYPIISNTSQSPIYEVEIISHHELGLMFRHFVEIVPPGTYVSGEGFDKEYWLELYFTDSSGIRWNRNNKGKLSQQSPYKSTGREKFAELYPYKKGNDSSGYLKDLANQLKDINKTLNKIKK